MSKYNIIDKLKNFFTKTITLKIIRVSVVLLPLILIVYFGVKFYLGFREKTRDPWDFLPENVFTVVQINNVQEFFQALTTDDLFADFENLLSAGEVKNNILFYDSLFATKEQIQEFWIKGNMLISNHFLGSGKFGTLFIKPLPHPNDKYKVFQFFEKHASQTTPYNLPGESADVYEYLIRKNKLYLCIESGVCLFTKTPELIRSSLIASRSKHYLTNDTSFLEVKNVVGKTCVANLFVHYRFMQRFLSGYLNGDVLKTLDVLDNFAAWTAYDIHTGEDKILNTGFTSTVGMETNWLDIFKTSAPQKTDIVEFLPFSTISFLWLGFDNYEDFREAYKHYLEKKDEVLEFNNNLTNLKRRTGVPNINELIYPFIDNQMAVFTMPDRTSANIQQLAIFKIKNKTQFRKNLHEIQKSASKVTKTNPDTSRYRNQPIITIHADYMLFDLFGKKFNSIEKTCYTLYENYWIVGNSHEAIKEYLNQIMSGRNLTKQPMYAQFSTSVAGDANVYIYASPRKMKNQIKNWFNEIHIQNVGNNISEFDAFEAIGIQFSSTKKFFLSSLSLMRGGNSGDDLSNGWEINIDGQVASGPWFVDVADQTAKFIIVFDAFNNMYYISEKGELLWKMPLPEKPISKVFAVDAYKNGKLQYLFNSENYLFLVDRNGKNVDQFPFKLPVSAAGPINVFDYDKTKDYRIIYPGMDNIIYNFNIKREATQGWEKPNLKTEAFSRVNHIRLANTDVLVIKDNKQHLHFFTRRGIYMFETKDIAFSQYSEVYPAPKLCRCFVTTTTDGQIAKIGTNGEIEYLLIHDASPGHVFLYEDIDKDGQQDFIFVDKGKAFMFQQDGNLIAGVEISQDAGRTSGFIKDSPFGPLIYTFSSDGGELYLINKLGRILPEITFPASGQADFYLSADGNKLMLTSAKGNTVFLTVVE